jgi:hypothetical protein
MNKINKGILICSTIFCATLQAGVVDDIFSSNFQFDSKIAFTSFEEPDVIESGKYFDVTPCTAHDLENHAGQPFVDTIGLLTTELGVDASFIPPDGCGGKFDDGVDNDFVGITSFDLNLTDINDVPVGGFSDGVRGYQISDPDGTFVLESEAIDLTGRANNSISIDYFLDDRSHFENPPAAGGWETNDGFRIYVRDMTNSTDIDVVNLLGGFNPENIDQLGIEYSWQSAVLMLPDNIVIKVVIEFTANSSREVVYIDNLEIRGTD